MHKKIVFALALLAATGFLGLIFYGPIVQWTSYHDFADKRSICGIPNFMDTLSNITFLFAGLFVLFYIKKFPKEYYLFFSAMIVSLCFLFFGSVFYHLAPSDARLVLDRLPIASFFSLLFLQILFETKVFNLSKKNLQIALIYWISSCLSVFVWLYTTDLRMYAFAQFFPLASLLILIPYCFLSDQKKKGWNLLFVILGYSLAKAFETFDYQLLTLTNGLISGHTMKHNIAGLTILIYFYFYKRNMNLTSNKE